MTWYIDTDVTGARAQEVRASGEALAATFIADFGHFQYRARLTRGFRFAVAERFLVQILTVQSPERSSMPSGRRSTSRPIGRPSSSGLPESDASLRRSWPGSRGAVAADNDGPESPIP